jgi:hypothetical protein
MDHIQYQYSGHCLYCHSDCFHHQTCTVCPQCGNVYHLECWEENGGCSQFGCKMAPVVKKRNEAEIPQSFWGKEEKVCPNCGKEILAAALRCRYCGARFKSEWPIESHEYETQERLRKKLPAIKRTLIFLFTTSIIVFSAPFGIVASCLWYKKNKKTLALLPSFFKTLIITGIIAGTTQILLVVLLTCIYSLLH